MARLKALSPDEATGKSKELFTAIQGKLGVVPNMMRTMGNSPALLEGYLNFSGALAHGKLAQKPANCWQWPYLKKTIVITVYLPIPILAKNWYILMLLL
jgi:hypothetical protein